MVKDGKELHVWQKSMQLVTDVYRAIEHFPKREIYGLTSQMRRAAVSIPSNLAEGHARCSTRDFRQFLFVSRASNSELQTQLEISQRLGFMEAIAAKSLLSQSIEVGKMLNGLIARLSERIEFASR